MTKLTPAIRSVSVALLAALAAVGCAPDDGSPALVDDDGPAATEAATAATSTSPTAPATSAAESSESGFELLCLPGEVRCSGNAILQTCLPTGAGWSDETCKANQNCVEGNGPEVADRCLGPCESEDILPSSAGCSFIANRQTHLVDRLGLVLDVPESDWEPDGFVVANAGGDLIATVQLYEIPEGMNVEEPFGEPFTLGPGEFRQFDLDSSIVLGASTALRAGGMLRVDADAPVIAYHHAPYRAFVGNDSSLMLPESALGKNYVVASYPPHYVQHQGAGEPTYFEIIAVENDTQIRWLAQFAATAGNGLPIDQVEEGEWSQDVKLNRYETLRVTASRNVNEENPHLRDVSGTVIEADKPIWVVGASRCSAVPISDDLTTGCDPLQEVLIPMEYWGDEYVAGHSPLRTTEQHHWRIYGADQGVEVTTSPPQDGTPYTFQSRGDYVDVVSEHGESFTVNSDGAVMVVGYLQTRDQTSDDPEEEPVQIGDPAMYQLVPTGQFLNNYVFVTGIDWDTHIVQVTRTVDGPDVFLDEVLLQDLEDDDSLTVTFETVPPGDYELVTVVGITEGAHQIRSAGPFGITQFGWANGEHDACQPPYSGQGTCQTSYAYPGGMRSEPIFIP